MNRKAYGTWAADDMADCELKNVFEGFYIDHRVVVRDSARPQVPRGGMPLLSLAGFTDYMSIDYAAEPDTYIHGLNAALRFFDVWPEEGPVPRNLLPATMPPQVERRIEESKLRCRKAVQEVMDIAKLESQMQAQTSQQIVDLFSDYRYVRY